MLRWAVNLHVQWRASALMKTVSPPESLEGALWNLQGCGAAVGFLTTAEPSASAGFREEQSLALLLETQQRVARQFPGLRPS
jgi:hypothetical protein